MLEDYGGWTEVASCPQRAVHLQTIVVLASAIPGLMNTGWWATWLVHKQLKKTNVRHPSEPLMHIYEINKEEALSCMFYNPPPHRAPRYLEQSISGLPCQHPYQSWTELNPRPKVRPLLYSPDHDMIPWCHDHLPFLFKQETPDVCAVESGWLACTGIPDLPFMFLHGQINKILYPIPMAMTHIPNVFTFPIEVEPIWGAN